MKKKYSIILVLALIALGNTVYLSNKAYQLLKPIPGEITHTGCDISGFLSCANVITHPATMIAGIPFPYFTLIAYAILIFVVIWGLISTNKKAATMIKWLSLGLLLFYGYIFFQEIFYVQAYCIPCLVCTAIIIIILGISLSLNKS